jgi:hypothetical protein
METLGKCNQCFQDAGKEIHGNVAYTADESVFNPGCEHSIMAEFGFLLFKVRNLTSDRESYQLTDMVCMLSPSTSRMTPFPPAVLVLRNKILMALERKRYKHLDDLVAMLRDVDRLAQLLPLIMNAIPQC